MENKIIENIIKLDKPGRDKTIKICDEYGWKFEEPERADLAYDCKIKFNSDIFAVVEIKNRSIKYENYDTLFLQQDKYENLLKWKKRLGADKALYFNWVGDNCYVFDIDKVDKTNDEYSIFKDLGIPYGANEKNVMYRHFCAIVEKYKEEETIDKISAIVYCEHKSQKGILIGKGGSLLKKIGTESRLELEKIVEKKVFLELQVKVEKDWRKKDKVLKTFGYQQEKE